MVCNIYKYMQYYGYKQNKKENKFLRAAEAEETDLSSKPQRYDNWIHIENLQEVRK